MVRRQRLGRGNVAVRSMCLHPIPRNARQVLGWRFLFWCPTTTPQLLEHAGVSVTTRYAYLENFLPHAAQTYVGSVFARLRLLFALLALLSSS